MTEQGSLRVLVAEDEPAMLSLVSRHLRSLGFKVIEASEGDAAWDLAQEHHPDLVILDVMMPGMSGWEICKRLKSHGSNGGQFENTGVIMLTGIGENLNEMTSPLFAADAWLNKPFEFNDLDARIRETLGRYDKSLPDGAVGVASQPMASPEEDRSDVDESEDEPAETQPMALPVRATAPKSGRRPAKAVPAKRAASNKPAAAKAKKGVKKAAKKAVKAAAKSTKRSAAKKPAKKTAKKSAKKASKSRTKSASKKTAKRR